MNIDSFEFVRNPCEDAAKWMKSQRSIKSAWKNCQRGTWMLWAILFSPTARKITDSEKDALIVWLRENIYASAYAYAYTYAYAYAYAYTYAYASAYASAYAYASASASADAKIADYLRKNIFFPWSEK